MCAGGESAWSSASFDFVGNQADYDLYKSTTGRQDMENAAWKSKLGEAALVKNSRFSSLDRKTKNAPKVIPHLALKKPGDQHGRGKATSMMDLSRRPARGKAEGYESDCCCPHCDSGDLSSCYCSCSCCEDHDDRDGDSCSDSEEDSRNSETGTVRTKNVGCRVPPPVRNILPSKIALPTPLSSERANVNKAPRNSVPNNKGNIKDGRKSADRESLSSVDSGTKTSFSGSNKSPSRASPATSPSSSSHGAQTEIEASSSSRKNSMNKSKKVLGTDNHDSISSSDSNYNSDEAPNKKRPRTV